MAAAKAAKQKFWPTRKIHNVEDEIAKTRECKEQGKKHRRWGRVKKRQDGVGAASGQETWKVKISKIR